MKAGSANEIQAKVLECEGLKALFNNVSTLKDLSCMALHAISVFGKVYKWNSQKIAHQKHHEKWK